MIAVGCGNTPPKQQGQQKKSDFGLLRFEYEQAQMGVPFKMILYAADESTAESAARAAFSRVEALNAIMSDYETDSEIMLLSRRSGSGEAVQVSSELWEVLHKAQSLAEESQGAFDVTIGPCVNLWRKARREKELPDADRLEQARSRVGYDKVVLDKVNRSVLLTAADMRLDLGGIAKGYAVDEAMKVLKQHGIKHALVAGSGDLLVSKAPPGKTGWTVELSAFDEGGIPKNEFILLSDKAVATSGDVFQRLEINGKRYSHIVNPRTCIGLTNQSLVTVIADNCTTADAMATTLSVLPFDQTTTFATRQKVAARIIQKPGARVEKMENGLFQELLVKHGFTHGRESYESIFENMWWR
ncbi:MAG: FAD:protein FMN transferase [Verrucomicrobiales bacterium]